MPLDLANEKQVKEWREKAEKGDAVAMYMLGGCYGRGSRGVAEDQKQARVWFEKGAALREPRAMANFASFLLDGLGGPAIPALGLVFITGAAGLGSEFAAFLLGEAHSKGKYGLPRDRTQALYWLNKVAKGKMRFKQLNQNGKTEVANLIQELG